MADSENGDTTGLPARNEAGSGHTGASLPPRNRGKNDEDTQPHEGIR